MRWLPDKAEDRRGWETCCVGRNADVCAPDSRSKIGLFVFLHRHRRGNGCHYPNNSLLNRCHAAIDTHAGPPRARRYPGTPYLRYAARPSIFVNHDQFIADWVWVGICGKLRICCAECRPIFRGKNGNQTSEPIPLTSRSNTLGPQECLTPFRAISSVPIPL